MEEKYKKFHIVAFDVPFPPSYGGIIDVFYKLKALHEAGAEIVLHCFHYKGHNPPNDELEKYCQKVHYYKRRHNIFRLLFGRKPYIVTTRSDVFLLMKLLVDPFTPILIEGIQGTFWLVHNDLREQKIIYRAHNIEHDYYNGLAAAEKNFLKRLYFKKEAKRLRRFEGQLHYTDQILSIAKKDVSHFEHFAKTIHMPPFFDDSRNLDFSIPQKEKFVLFQANLSVIENENAAMHIVNRIAPMTDHKFKIAGQNPSKKLKKSIASSANVELIESPTETVMSELMNEAQVHLLMSFLQSGVKLKLLNALQAGRHIIINKYMNDEEIFSDMCDVIDRTEDTAKRIDEMMSIEFTAEMKLERDAKFKAVFSNQMNAKTIMDLVHKLTDDRHKSR